MVSNPFSIILISLILQKIDDQLSPPLRVILPRLLLLPLYLIHLSLVRVHKLLRKEHKVLKIIPFFEHLIFGSGLILQFYNIFKR